MIAQASNVSIELPAAITLGVSLLCAGAAGGWFTARSRNRQIDASATRSLADAAAALGSGAGQVVHLQAEAARRLEGEIAALRKSLGREREARQRLAARLGRIETYARQLAEDLRELGSHPPPFPD